MFEFSSTRFFSVHFVAKRKTTSKVSEGTNRNFPARNTLVQLLAMYTDPESHNAHRYKEQYGQTRGRMDDDVSSRSYSVEV